MRIFITGATGFIGTHVARHLSAQGHRLVCLVRKTSHIQNLEEIGADLIWGDVRDKRTMLPAMSGCDALIHLAGISSFWEPNNKIFAEVNVIGTRNVMECALEAVISRVILVSSLYIYGKPSGSPFNEESTIGPQRFSEFARTKHEAERIAWMLYHKKNLPLTVCYPALVLGPGRTIRSATPIHRLLNNFFIPRSCLNSRHTYTHVQDVVQVISRVLTLQGAIGQRYFIAGERISTRRLLISMAEITGIRQSKITLPDSLAMLMAKVFAIMAKVTKKPPRPEMCPDYLLTIQKGLMADGQKVIKEMGIIYTPIREALKGEIESMQMNLSINERRRARRHPVKMDIIYKAEGDESEIAAETKDISENGILLNTFRPCPRGRYVSINLSGRKSGEYCFARGRVARNTRNETAIEFIHKDRDIRSILADRQFRDMERSKSESLRASSQ